MAGSGLDVMEGVVELTHRCIYCGQDHDLSESDIIPDALTNARILNRNVCRIEHNNKFSDMFESKVIDALGFITNELDIKSSKGKKYASYDAVVTIEGIDYNLKLHGDNEIFNGRVIKSSDNKHMISSYDRAVKIAKDESKVQSLDVNAIEIQKRVSINNGIFFDISMYRMLSKIAFEWYCAKNDVSDYCSEFSSIIEFITTGNGTNPVSIIQEEEIYKMIDQLGNLGSHILFTFEKEDGEIDVIISLFGLLIYRVIVAKHKPSICVNNYLYTELRTDSSRKEIVHQSVEEAQEKFYGMFAQDKFVSAGVINGVSIMIPKVMVPMQNVEIYPLWFNITQYLSKVDADTAKPNKIINKIFLEQLKNITQASTLQKKSIKRFVNETFCEGHETIRLNPDTSNKKATVLFYVVYLIGISEEAELNDRVLQKIIKEGLPNLSNEEFIIDDEMESKLKRTMMEKDNYSDILEKGAEKVINWKN